MRKYKIGVFGSAVIEPPETIEKAKELGEILSKENVIVITGACLGIPYVAASRASKNGTEIVGYSPGTTLKEQENLAPGCDSSIYKELIYIPKDYEFAKNDLICRKYRNVTSTANCDAGIIIAGRWGTMNEFTNLFDMGKAIGVLTGTGGVADEIKKLNKKITKKSNAKVFFSSSPQKLVGLILAELKTRHNE